MTQFFQMTTFLSGMTFFNNYRFFILLLVCVFTRPLLAADISVSVDRNPVNLQESFQITFTANEQPNAEPDFAPLDKDFEILNQSQQQSVQINNWKKTNSIQWILTVMAKHAGNLVIPAINFGQDNSQYTSILVNEAQDTGMVNEDLFLQVEVDTPKPYIQEQVIYTLKLFRKVNISQASLTEPELQDAMVEKLGEDKNYNTRFQGENYVVTERKYAIFPQKSGTLTIAPLRLTAGIIILGQRQTNSFFNRQRTRNKRVVSAAITLDVQPKPANAGVDWLPAKQVFLQEEWTDNLEEMVVGQPFTRTITLQVEGATVGGLSELYKDNMPPHLKAYPDQPVLEEKATDSGMLALRQEKVALIPSRAGSFTLPAIEIPWWNTRTQKMEVARIAERTITAIAATGATTVLEPTPPLVSPAQAAAGGKGTQKTLPIQQQSTLWFWLTLFFALAWLVTLAYFLSRKLGKTKKQPVTVEKKSTAKKMLQKACADNDPILAKDALLQWGRDQFKQSSLTKIAEQSGPLLQAEILVLNTILYSDKTQAWQGAELWAAFQNNQSVDVVKKDLADPLPPLFKI